MNDIIVAVIAFLGTAVGAYYSNQKTTALVIYRLEQLEVKVNKHNNLIERTYKLEEAEAVLKEKIDVANHRIEDLEKFHQ